ncbi:hypothetical protein IKG07_01410 [Candidatus Saccharibacteria bacterium]|nr:hypothetical protein [Candidatus Saccharibacteria bacterium]
MKIAILGAGAFGTALGGILANKGYDIDYYDSKVEKESLSKVLSDTKFIVLVVPSQAAPYLLPHLPVDKPLIVATKGFLDSHNFADFKDYMVLSGPGFAADIKAGKKTLLTATDQRIIELFTTDYLTFDFTVDKNGVLMCGALKNVYAIYAGYLDLKPGTPEHERYLTEVSEEMKALLLANSSDPKTVDLSCGKGDLRLTCDFPSRNYEFGQILRKNHQAVPEKTVEGLTALAKIKRGEIKIPDSALKLLELIKISDDWNFDGIK